MNTYVDVGGSETLALKGALLVYEGRGRAFVTWHEARFPETGVPYLGEAQELTTEFVKRLSQGLGTNAPADLLPENVLVWTAELAVWWTLRSVRRMFFRSGSEAPADFNGEHFSQPALVWKVAGHDLAVRALAENHRPRAKTPLMVAPYWNVDGDSGTVCQGSMRAPEEPGVAAIPLWEQSFFQSEFTHQTGVKRLVNHRRGFFQLWGQVKGGRRRFPSRCLVPANETLTDFIRRDR